MGRSRMAVAAVLMVWFMALGAAPVAASSCKLWVLCGSLEVVQESPHGILVANDWPPARGQLAWVRPGERSPFRDTDAFYLPEGRLMTTYGSGRQVRNFLATPGWHKFNSLQELKVKVQKY